MWKIFRRNYTAQMGRVGVEVSTVGEERRDYDDVPADAADEDGADEIAIR